MELVYLWVEEYKNIKSQGFNFSPRFECEFFPEYDENQKLKDNCKLEIKPKEYTSIFPENINVTAIVGENGSGKSSLATLLLGSIMQNGHEIKNANWRGIKNLLFAFKNYETSEIKAFTFSGIKNQDNKFLPFTIQKVLAEALYKKESNTDNILTCVAQDLFYKSYYLFIDFSIMDINLWNDDAFKENFALEPSRDYKTSGPEWSSKLSSAGFASNMKSNLVYFYRYIDDDLKQKMSIPNFDSIKIYGKKRVKEDKLKDELEQANNFFKDNNNFLNLNKENFDKRSFASESKRIVDLTDEEMNAISYFDTFCDIELETQDKDIYFYNLSTGTKILLSYFGIICKTIIKRLKDRKTIYITIDEVENSLHPKWQKEFVNMLILFLSNWQRSKNIKIHLILLTHSPFILSDLPKENVIFLKKDENGNCKNVTKETNIETFGANIHTLLSHGFFLRDGLMGEFAKGKINEAIKYLNQKTLTEKEINYCENIIFIIGEPIIKRQLQKMLDGKRLARYDKVNERIKDLEYELTILKNHQNKTLKDEFLNKGKRKYTKKKTDDKN